MYGHAQSGHREFWEVVDWDAYQYSDVRKKPAPPWKWFKFQTAILRSPDWLAMSKPLRADFISVLGAASATGNLIPADDRWLKSHQLSAKTLQKLSKTGLIEKFSLPEDSIRIKNLRRIFSGGPPVLEGEGEGEGEVEVEVEVDTVTEGSGTVEPTTGNDPNHLPQSALKNNSVPGPTPISPTGISNVIDDALRPNLTKSRWKNGGGQQGHDPRPFEWIKAKTLELARQLNTRDAEMLFRCCGQSTRISLKQFRAAMSQLINDGELER